MNKFLWRLFGIDEDEVPDVSRRAFLRMLGGAAVVGAAAPKYFLAPNGGWNAGNLVKPMLSYEDLSAATINIPIMVDKIFSGGIAIRTPIQYERLGSL